MNAQKDKCPRCGNELTPYKSTGGGNEEAYICTKCGIKIYKGGIVPPDNIVGYMRGKSSL